ncbi:MAG: sodium:alanine symporter, partial [Gammaproteobacteria bacterium]
AQGIDQAFGVSHLVVGGVIVFFLAIIIIGGVKRIGKVSEIVVPFMAIAYVLVAIIIIGMNITEVPHMIVLIVKSAFGAEPAFGGIVGMAIAMGVKRGIYSNEAGQGTAPHAAAAAEVSHPAKQGLVQAFSVYVDTLLVCTATAFMILFTGQYNVIGPDGAFIIENIPGVEIGPEYTQLAVAHQLPGFGKIFVAISLTFFAFTTIMAYYYIAETNVAYLEGKKDRKWMIWALRVLILGATFFGTMRSAELAWMMGDIGVGIMAWLNFVAIFLLRKPALKALKDYEQKRNKGIENPSFDPEELGIKNAELWKDIN